EGSSRVSARAGEIQNVVASPGEDHHPHTDICQHAVDRLGRRVDDVLARLAVDDDAADGEKAAVADHVHAELDAVVRVAVHHPDSRGDGNIVIAGGAAHVQRL